MYGVPQQADEEDLPIVPMKQFMSEAKELHKGLTEDCIALKHAVEIRYACASTAAAPAVSCRSVSSLSSLRPSLFVAALRQLAAGHKSMPGR